MSCDRCKSGERHEHRGACESCGREAVIYYDSRCAGCHERHELPSSDTDAGVG